MNSGLSDVMYVLIMVVPQFMHAAPSPEQLEVVAWNLFARGPILMQREVRREGVSTLMNLLLRMRLSNEKWGSSYHLGDFVDTSRADKEMTEALVNSLTGGGSEQTITFDQLLLSIDMVVSVYSFQVHEEQFLLNPSQPNLQVRFYQLWAALFQPSAPTAEAKLSRALEARPTHINGAVWAI